MDNEELRDKAALAVLAGILSKHEYHDDGDIAKATVNAYRYADAVLAARELPQRHEYYAERYRREADRKEKERIACEAWKKTAAPLHEWAVKNWNPVFKSAIFDFLEVYRPKENDDIVEAFKVWHKEQTEAFACCLF